MSERLDLLITRAAELRAHLVPALDPLGSYTRQQLDCVRGYRLLIHAEIESLVEDLAVQAAKDSLAEFQRTRRITLPLVSLLAHRVARLADIPSGFSTKQRLKGNVPDSLDGRLERCVADFESTVRASNNGIKEQDLARMLLPVGVRGNDLDRVWLNAMSSYSTLRGDVAHNSHTVQKLIDPKSELDAVDILIEGAKQLDHVISNLMV